MDNAWTSKDMDRLSELFHKERTEEEEAELSILFALRTITIIRKAA